MIAEKRTSPAIRSTSTAKNKKNSNSDPLSAKEVRKMNAYWHACNYLCAGMLYLRENPLL
jgi:xylulose-5-phosphate/fructose-6-phosphate phosphoketolase